MEDKKTEKESQQSKEDSKFQPINIKALATRVSPKLGKFIPRFMYNKFEKILHIKELNTFFEAHCNDEPQAFLDATVEFLDIKLVLEDNAGLGGGARKP
jgi:hypothetical protein